jgi:hypothetical protein
MTTQPTCMPEHPCATDRIDRPALKVDWTCPTCDAKWVYRQVDAFTRRFGWVRMEPAHV